MCVGSEGSKTVAPVEVEVVLVEISSISTTSTCSTLVLVDL